MIVFDFFDDKTVFTKEDQLKIFNFKKDDNIKFINQQYSSLINIQDSNLLKMKLKALINLDEIMYKLSLPAEDRIGYEYSLFGNCLYGKTYKESTSVLMLDSYDFKINNGIKECDYEYDINSYINCVLLKTPKECYTKEDYIKRIILMDRLKN